MAGSMSEAATMESAAGRIERLRWLPLASLAALSLVYLRTLGGPSLWLDEAWEASYYVGIEPMPSYERPLLYVSAVQALVRLFGPGELVLRLLPCLAGIGAVAATFRLAREELGEAGAWIAAGFLAVTPPFVFQSHLLSSYPFDALFTAVLLLAYRAYAGDRRPRRLLLYLALAALSFGFTFTSVFLVAAVAGIEAVARRRELRALVPFAAAHLGLAGLFGAVLLGLHLQVVKDEILRSYYAEFYPSPWELEWLPAWTAQRTADLLAELTGIGSGVAATLLVAAGVWRLARGADPGRGVAAMAVPALLVANLGAAAIHVYPYGVERLSLYLSPLVSLAVAAAATALVPLARASLPVALTLAGLAYPLLYPSLAQSMPDLGSGWTGEHIRPLVETLALRREPQEAIYVSDGAVPAFRYYWWRAGQDADDPAVIWGERHRLHPLKHAPQVEALASEYPRLWCLYSHVPREEREALRELFGRRYGTIESYGRLDVALDRLVRTREAAAEADGAPAPLRP